ncbi:heavy-metal-associated domain-containing protein [Variovorax sp. RA8]|uniref:heavy-metal-associated domain-containing protein n=1 Tax=Variovorax sp. (strain JCM 16519 / RA8) TaxID=662548 RepID=UPI001E48DFD4|nr:heavy metal-associated domain-containing protein [Variovorax sp. RA8]
MKTSVSLLAVVLLGAVGAGGYWLGGRSQGTSSAQMQAAGDGGSAIAGGSGSEPARMTNPISTPTSKGYDMETIELEVQGMTCGSCVDSVKRVLQRVPGVSGVDVNLSLGRARVTTIGNAAAALGALTAALDAAGYPSAPAAAMALDAAPSSGHTHTGGCGHASGPKKQGGCCCG